MYFKWKSYGRIYIYKWVVHTEVEFKGMKRQQKVHLIPRVFYELSNL